MSKPYRLSRISFIAGSGAFLAACSSQRAGTLPTIGSQSPRSVRDIAPAAGVAVKRRFQFSCSRSGHAIALHTRSGRFVYSCAYGPAFVRRTFHDGRQEVVDRALPQKRGWYRYESGGAARVVRSKSGTLAVCAVSSNRTKRFAYFKDDAMVVLVPGEFAIAIPLRGASASPTSTPHEKLHSLMDHVGTWAHDDDFTGAPGDYAPGTGYIKTGAAKSSARSRPAGGRRATSTSVEQPVDMNDPGGFDPWAGSLDPGFDLGFDPYDTPWDLVADPDAIDPALDTGDIAFDIPDDALAAKNKCDKEIADAAQALRDFQSAMSKRDAACGAGKKSVARSVMAVKKRPPRPPISFACWKASVDYGQASAALGAANAAVDKCKHSGVG